MYVAVVQHGIPDGQCGSLGADPGQGSHMGEQAGQNLNLLPLSVPVDLLC